MIRQDHPRVFVDFNNADAKGRVRLNTVGTIRDLSRERVHLCAGASLDLYAEDDVDEEGRPEELRVPGVVEYSHEEHGWVAVIDWAAIRHVTRAQALEEAPAPHHLAASDAEATGL